MISTTNINRVTVLLTIPIYFFVYFDSPLTILGIMIGIFTYLRSTFEFESLFSYLGLWISLLIQCIILIYIIWFSMYNFYGLIPYIILLLGQMFFYTLCQPMFHVLTCKL